MSIMVIFKHLIEPWLGFQGFAPFLTGDNTETQRYSLGYMLEVDYPRQQWHEPAQSSGRG